MDKGRILLPIFTLFGCSVYGADKTDNQPNIVLINIDDLGWADLGYMGSNYYETPNIDRLRQKAVNFSNGYAASANSAPSRACMMTGQYTPRHGVYTVTPSTRGRSEDRKLIPVETRKLLAPDATTLPMVLQKAGYATCHIGKWHLGEDPTKQGIDTNIGGYEAGLPKSYFSPYKNAHLKDGEDGEYLVERLASEAVNYIDTIQRGKPFFLYYAPYAVHSPWIAKKEMVEKYKAKHASATEAHFDPVYAAMVESMDTAVGRVIDAIERSGESKNTLIIFVSDNGGVYKVSHQWPLRAGKGSFYEGGIRVPFMIYMDGCYEGGIEHNVAVSNIDLFPTILDVARVKSSLTLDGKSLIPILDRGATKRFEKRALYWFSLRILKDKRVIKRPKTLSLEHAQLA